MLSTLVASIEIEPSDDATEMELEMEMQMEMEKEAKTEAEREVTDNSVEEQTVADKAVSVARQAAPILGEIDTPATSSMSPSSSSSSSSLPYTPPTGWAGRGPTAHVMVVVVQGPPTTDVKNVCRLLAQEHAHISFLDLDAVVLDEAKGAGRRIVEVDNDNEDDDENDDEENVNADGKNNKEQSNAEAVKDTDKKTESRAPRRPHQRQRAARADELARRQHRRDLLADYLSIARHHVRHDPLHVGAGT